MSARPSSLSSHVGPPRTARQRAQLASITTATSTTITAARVAARTTAASGEAPPASRPITAPFEVLIVKHGVPWRGSYRRTLVVESDRVVTLDPETRRETNSYVAPRDVFKAEVQPAALLRLPADPMADSLAVCLHVAPWPHAPAWLAQKVFFSAGEQTEAVIDAFDGMGIPIERGCWF